MAVISFATQNHADVVQDPVAEIAGGGKTLIIDIFDVIAGDGIAPLKCTLAVAAPLIISASGRSSWRIWPSAATPIPAKSRCFSG
jgi:hypothetical protein